MDQAPAESPQWMTLKQTVEFLQVNYQRRSYETVRNACLEYQRTKGEFGLKCAQGGAGKRYLVHRDDAARWITGKAPNVD